MSLGRVYVKFGKDYEGYSVFNEFDSLLEAVAFSVKYGNGKALVKTVADKTIPCLSNTKKYIAAEATRLIKRIKIYRNPSGDHMALYTSKRQINRLARVCKCTGNDLSCYSLLVLHIIYISINQTNRDNFRIVFNDLEDLIYKIADNYMQHHGCDDLAQYIVNCHPRIRQEIQGGVICSPNHLPDIHRWF